MTKAAAKRKRSVPKAEAPAPSLPVLSNRDRGRLMGATDASPQTVDAWWRGQPVKPVTRRALETAAKRLRIIVPYPSTTKALEKTG